MTEKVTELLKKKNLDAILISDGYNMRYLSGFGGATGYLYISADPRRQNRRHRSLPLWKLALRRVTGS